MMKGVFRFEDISEDLPLLPLAARRALDVAGRRLSLSAWKRLTMTTRRAIVEEGAAHEVDVDSVRARVVRAEPPCDEMACADEAELDAQPEGLVAAMSPERWAELSRLERFALRHVARKDKGRRLREALDEIAPAQPTHLDEHGEASMVDVGAKPVTHRQAIARARVRMRPETARIIQSDDSPKGDVIAAARIAGIMGAKRTSELIPLCHPLSLNRVSVTFEVNESEGVVTITSTADAHDRTGVEMEAMTAATVAALTVYDMLKSVERGIRIEEVVLLEKQGGRSGHYVREETAEKSA